MKRENIFPFVAIVAFIFTCGLFVHVLMKDNEQLARLVFRLYDRIEQIQQEQVCQ